MLYHARGVAMSIATPMSAIKSFDSNATILLTLAPNTLRMPISLVRISVVYVARPSRPRQAIKIAREEKMENNDLKLKSFLYWRLKSSSRERSSKRPGLDQVIDTLLALP